VRQANQLKEKEAGQKEVKAVLKYKEGEVKADLLN
jgi:hypothetical protein